MKSIYILLLTLSLFIIPSSLSAGDTTCSSTSLFSLVEGANTIDTITHSGADYHQLFIPSDGELEITWTADALIKPATFYVGRSCDAVDIYDGTTDLSSHSVSSFSVTENDIIYLKIDNTNNNEWYVIDIFFSVVAVNNAPSISSTNTFSIIENTTAVTTITASDVDGDTLVYSISGGDDSGDFSINSSSGDLTFNSAPDYESPTDLNTDNVYQVQISVSDGNGGSDALDIEVTIVDDPFESITNTADICYDPVNGGCDMFFISCSTSIPINNISNSNLIDTQLFVDTSNFFSFFSNCSIDSGTNGVDCTNESSADFGPLSFLAQGTQYDLGNILTTNDPAHTVDQESLFTFPPSGASPDIYATYTKDNVDYDVQVYACTDTALPVPTLIIDDNSISSSDASQTMTFTINIDPVANVGAGSTVEYYTQNGTAEAGIDYVSTSGTITLPTDGSTTTTVDVTINASSEGDFYLMLHNPYNAGIQDGNATGTITVSDSDTIPEEENMYSCGIFPSVLASFISIDAEKNDIFNTCHISVHELDFNENHPAQNVTCYEDEGITPCVCDPLVSVCNKDESCEVLPEPTNRYDHEFISTTDENSTTTSSDVIFTDYQYGNYTFTNNSGQDIYFNPSITYSGSDRKVMLIGDITNGGNNQTMRFEEGDYYFKSWDMGGNQINIEIDGDVKIFIEGNLVYDGNHANVEDSYTSDDSLFIYVGGDATFGSNGGGNSWLGMFIYVEGDVVIESNANAADLYGGITAEGTIDITGNNMNFIYNEDGAANLGFGECTLCFTQPTESIGTMVSTNILNTGVLPLFDVVISKAYDYSAYTSIASTTTSGTSTSSANILVELVDYPNFPNPTTTSGFVYTIGDFSLSQNDIITDTTDITFDIEDYNISFKSGVKAIYLAEYNDGDKNYNVVVDQCWDGGATSFEVSGPFDAWDTFRNDASVPPADKNISTKVVNQPFRLSLASLNETLTAYETKRNSGSAASIQVAIYPEDSLQAISTPVLFDANASANITSLNITPTAACQDAIVGFKLCATYQNNVFTLFPEGECSDAILTSCFEETAGSPRFHLCRSTDNLAIRPDNLTLTAPVALLTSGADINYSITAEQFNSSTATNDYNISSTALSIGKSAMYLPNDTVNNTLNGTLNFSSTPFNIVNGFVANAGINFSDVGKVTIHIQDTSWSVVDFDDTPQTCDDNQSFGTIASVPNGTYVCGDVNSTFIPDHFALSVSQIYNNTNANHTYISNDLNMSAHASLTIAAENALNATTSNFDSASWENPVNVNLSLLTTTQPLLNKDDINETLNIGFTGGLKSVLWTETNSSQNIMFNFQRDTNVTLNPFVINGSNVNLTANSTYPSVPVVTGSTVSSSSATFIYGRTNAPRQRINGNSGTALIYYEAFCSGVDSNGTTCNKSFLPNGPSSKSNDDPRWFKNTLHNVATLNHVGVVAQKSGLGIVTAGTANNANPSSVTLTYTEANTRGYPYKTTMENTPATWLVYNKYDSLDTTNEFEVEFEGGSSSWAGKHETDTTTNAGGTIKTNRRSMW